MEGTQERPRLKNRGHSGMIRKKGGVDMEDELKELFLAPLDKMSLYELARWIWCVRGLALDSNYNVDPKRVTELWEKWTQFYMNPIDPDTLYIAGETAQRLADNYKVMHSAKYRRAILALARRPPQFWIKPGKSGAPVCCNNLIYNNQSQNKSGKINAQGDKAFDKFAKEYQQEIKACLEDGLGDPYRKRIVTLIDSCQVCRNITYHMPDISSKKALEEELSKRPAWVLARLPKLLLTTENRYTKANEAWNMEQFRYFSEGDVKQAKKASDIELQKYGISRQVKQNYIDGVPVEKSFMVRLAFYLGLDAESAKTLLSREGYALKGSVRPSDQIILTSLSIGFPVQYVNELLKQKGHKPILPESKSI